MFQWQGQTEASSPLYVNGYNFMVENGWDRYYDFLASAVYADAFFSDQQMSCFCIHSLR